MKNALVTGANRGIGLETCRQLAAQGFRVFLCARDAQRGQKAAESLAAQGLAVEFLQMDVADEQSILAAAAALSARINALHALVNNAGIFLEEKQEGLAFTTQQIMDTFRTNTLGPLLVTRAFLPLLEAAKGAQVVNVSSGMGQLEDMREGSPGYRISKTGLNAVTCTLAAELSDKRIKVNSICPGWVKTDMGGAGANKSVEQGADTITWLAAGTSPATGRFFRDRKEIPW